MVSARHPLKEGKKKTPLKAAEYPKEQSLSPQAAGNPTRRGSAESRLNVGKFQATFISFRHCHERRIPHEKRQAPRFTGGARHFDHLTVSDFLNISGIFFVFPIHSFKNATPERKRTCAFNR
jgi:hypothetical protein